MGKASKICILRVFKRFMKLRHLFLWVLVLTGFSCNTIRNLLRPNPEFTSNRLAAPAELITKIPFVKFTGGVIVLRGLINDSKDTLNFILDTGSGGISLDSVTCERLGLKVQSSDRFIRGIGGIKRLFFSSNNRLKFPGLEIDSLDFHISNYNFISSVYGVEIDGIIGYSFLKRYIIQVNYDSMKLFVYTPGRFDYGRGGELLNPVIRNIPIIAAPLKNRDLYNTRYFFDMGAGLCLMLSNRFAGDSCVFCSSSQRKHKFIKTKAQGIIGEITMTQTVVQGYQVGRYYFRNVPTYLFDDVSNVTAYPELGGLVGNDLLRRFNVTLNYPENQIYLVPNSHFNEPFDYSYTGLVMYFIDGHITITDINKDSPAEKAGLQPGDIVMAVDHDFSNNIQQYRELLKATGSRVDLIILRDGELKQVKLQIKSIL